MDKYNEAKKEGYNLRQTRRRNKLIEKNEKEGGYNVDPKRLKRILKPKRIGAKLLKKSRKRKETRRRKRIGQ